MQELEKILEEIDETIERYGTNPYIDVQVTDLCYGLNIAKDIIRRHMNDGWIPVEERLPECEEEVCILTDKKTITTAIYEDGTMHEIDSCWYWQDINWEFDAEYGSQVIPKGWWEYRHFNPDQVYNNVVDEKVIAWRPLPKPYHPEPLETRKELEEDSKGERENE